MRLCVCVLEDGLNQKLRNERDFVDLCIGTSMFVHVRVRQFLNVTQKKGGKKHDVSHRTRQRNGAIDKQDRRVSSCQKKTVGNGTGLSTSSTRRQRNGACDSCLSPYSCVTECGNAFVCPCVCLSVHVLRNRVCVSVPHRHGAYWFPPTVFVCL